jgi:hypothetical protein
VAMFRLRLRRPAAGRSGFLAGGIDHGTAGSRCRHWAVASQQSPATGHHSSSRATASSGSSVACARCHARDNIRRTCGSSATSRAHAQRLHRAPHCLRLGHQLDQCERVTAGLRQDATRCRLGHLSPSQEAPFRPQALAGRRAARGTRSAPPRALCRRAARRPFPHPPPDRPSPAVARSYLYPPGLLANEALVRTRPRRTGPRGESPRRPCRREPAADRAAGRHSMRRRPSR